MSIPLVSVLTTSYNRQDYIGEAIESVLASTLTNFEYIIVDDCSTDNTVEIARNYEKADHRIKVFVNEKNLGDYNNRNKAAEYAIGKYIKYIDSDDIIYPYALEAMVTAMEKFPEAGFGLSSKGDDGQPFPVMVNPHQAYHEHFHGYGHFFRAPGSAIINREAFNKVGRFSGERMIGDTELWFRMARNYPLVKFPPDLYWARSHGNQESQSDYARRQYEMLQKRVLTDAFGHKDCPLTSEEKQTILAKMKKTRLKQSIRKYLPV
ncbi:MAG TPA: glycosyltransferase family 2 protein [Flavisolibacter sp.]|nr:glycosyltransferase family 2 protein [Flavisolibacter sp.]